MSLSQFFFIAGLQTALSGLVSYLALNHFRQREKHVQLIGLLFLIGFLSNTIVPAMTFTGIPHGNVIYSFYTIFMFLVINALYFEVLGRKHSRWFIAVCVVCSLLFLLNLIFVQKGTINSYSKALAGFIIIIYALIYFSKLIIGLPTTEFKKLPMFWFNSAILMFYSGTFFLFVVNAYMINVMNSKNIDTWAFHNILSIIEHLIVFVGLYYERRARVLVAQRA